MNNDGRTASGRPAMVQLAWSWWTMGLHQGPRRNSKRVTIKGIAGAPASVAEGGGHRTSKAAWRTSRSSGHCPVSRCSGGCCPTAAALAAVAALAATLTPHAHRRLAPLTGAGRDGDRELAMPQRSPPPPYSGPADTSAHRVRRRQLHGRRGHWGTTLSYTTAPSMCDQQECGQHGLGQLGSAALSFTATPIVVARAMPQKQGGAASKNANRAPTTRGKAAEGVAGNTNKGRVDEGVD